MGKITPPHPIRNAVKQHEAVKMSAIDLTFLAKRAAKKLFGIKTPPREVFGSDRFQKINRARLEHLASLGLELTGLSVLEVGAGIGDHTSFFLDRGCQVVSTEARAENLEILRSRYPNVLVEHLDLDHPRTVMNKTFDLIYCYGLLYHLKKPAEAIAFMSRLCQKMLLIETRVSFDDQATLNLTRESPDYPSASTSGYCSKPARQWVYNQLKRYFEFVYLPLTQPNHEEFPVDWTMPPPDEAIARAIFIASRQRLNNNLLTESLPSHQNRH